MKIINPQVYKIYGDKFNRRIYEGNGLQDAIGEFFYIEYEYDDGNDFGCSFVPSQTLNSFGKYVKNNNLKILYVEPISESLFITIDRFMRQEDSMVTAMMQKTPTGYNKIKINEIKPKKCNSCSFGEAIEEFKKSINNEDDTTKLRMIKTIKDLFRKMDNCL